MANMFIAILVFQMDYGLLTLRIMMGPNLLRPTKIDMVESRFLLGRAMKMNLSFINIFFSHFLNLLQLFFKSFFYIIFTRKLTYAQFLLMLLCEHFI